jgi:uncharacterized phage-associated protein
MPRLSFSFKLEKFVEASFHLAQRCPDMTKMKLFKLLYFADKYHLSEFGRPIFGGHYVALKDGPVPSEAYDVVKGISNPFHDVFTVSGHKITVNPSANPGAESLSESDIEALDKISDEIGILTAAQLRSKSHADPAWSRRDRNDDMDFADMIPGVVPEFRDLIFDDQSIRDLVDDVSLIDEPSAA